MLIDLTNYGKVELPPELFNFHHITRLILRAHGLRNVSADIRKLSNLIQLDLCSFNMNTRAWHSFLDKYVDGVYLYKASASGQCIFIRICTSYETDLFLALRLQILTLRSSKTDIFIVFEHTL